MLRIKIDCMKNVTDPSLCLYHSPFPPPYHPTVQKLQLVFIVKISLKKWKLLRTFAQVECFDQKEKKIFWLCMSFQVSFCTYWNASQSTSNSCNDKQFLCTVYLCFRRFADPVVSHTSIWEHQFSGDIEFLSKDSTSLHNMIRRVVNKQEVLPLYHISGMENPPVWCGH